MPFNSAGVYTPASGATTAVPGQLIQSAVWNAIFTDISSALTLLGQQLYGSTSVSTTTYAPVAADSFLLVNDAAPVTINLPTAASRSGYPLVIKDASGAAHTNSITITANGVETIDGQTSVTIAVDYGSFNLFPVSGGWVTKP